MLGYDIGIRKMCFSVSAGTGNGTDNQFLAADKMDDGKEVQKVRGSQTIYPAIFPDNSYLESCNSTYQVRQLRLGFTIFIRRNDTLGRHPCTGLHFGTEAVFMNTIENQTVIYKSLAPTEELYTYSGINKFNELGAATHVGWQFAFFKEHLYVDLRAVLPFYYPFMPEPNLNSPFAGNKWELQASIGWHFYRKKEETVKDSDKDQIRQKI
ncbi:MAG TPA: hypothetical protein VFJ43_02010, partial [Bacteroidia bacterium]|nr:hypothetical protein [Bacteroidia bacterium]